MKWIDSHSHWSDERLLKNKDFGLLLSKAHKSGVQKTLMGGVEPEEWSRQLELQKTDPDFFKTCFGLHPYKVKNLTDEEIEHTLDLLALQSQQADAIGEMGLDKRPDYWTGHEVRQIEVFENQLQWANSIRKPVVLHIVKAHEEALKILQMWIEPHTKGFVHAFNGAYDWAQKYIEFGLKISIGGALTHPRNKELHEAVRKLPLEALLIESDAPDQKPYKWDHDVNDSSSVALVGAAIAEIKGLPVEKVAEQTVINFNSLF